MVSATTNTITTMTTIRPTTIDYVTTTKTEEPTTEDNFFTPTTIAESTTLDDVSITTEPTTEANLFTTTAESTTQDSVSAATTESTTKDTISTTVTTSESTMTNAISNTLTETTSTNAISTITPQTTSLQITTTQDGNVCFDCNCALNTSSVTTGEFLLGNNKTVFCVMDTVNNHKWTIIQKRFSSGLQSFDKNWSDYENGFGSLSADFWIGNKYLHELTSIYGNTRLRIEMTTPQGKRGFVEYTFFIDDASQNYTLHTSNYNGMLGDPFTSSGSCTECADGMKFTTKDRDNDLDSAHNCASLSGGGWWHNACQRSNLNGLFGQSSYLHGFNWNGFVDFSFVQMKVRKP
ncbi:fibrinogen-like protein A [Saccostrea cucullata]|uniref:fibrinogen-like protein A n=1 Tax=Saccostrea cuccullata TaxID=36930 RepID=UPI002ED3BA96